MRFQMREIHRSFLLGCSVGIFVCLLFMELRWYSQNNECHQVILDDEFASDSEEMHNQTYDSKYWINKTSKHGPVVFNDLDSLYHRGGDRVAKRLAKKIRVLCWVLTQPKNLQTKAQAVKDTWGKRCNVLLFMSSKEDKDFPVVGLDVQEGEVLSFDFILVTLQWNQTIRCPAHGLI